MPLEVHDQSPSAWPRGSKFDHIEGFANFLHEDPKERFRTPLWCERGNEIMSNFAAGPSYRLSILL